MNVTVVFLYKDLPRNYWFILEQLWCMITGFMISFLLHDLSSLIFLSIYLSILIVAVVFVYKEGQLFNSATSVCIHITRIIVHAEIQRVRTKMVGMQQPNKETRPQPPGLGFWCYYNVVLMRDSSEPSCVVEVLTSLVPAV